MSATSFKLVSYKKIEQRKLYTVYKTDAIQWIKFYNMTQNIPVVYTGQFPWL